MHEHLNQIAAVYFTGRRCCLVDNMHTFVALQPPKQNAQEPLPPVCHPPELIKGIALCQRVHQISWQQAAGRCQSLAARSFGLAMQSKSSSDLP
jgi:hypothetical protein